MTSRRWEVQVAVGSMGVGGEGSEITALEETHNIISTDMHMYISEMRQCTEVKMQSRRGVRGMRSNVVKRRFMPSEDNCARCGVETDCILLLIAKNIQPSLLDPSDRQVE